MATKKKKGPGPTEPLEPKVVGNLLDLLSTDNTFRRLFKKDAHAALVQAGWKAPAGAASGAVPVAALSGGNCMQLSAGDRIAPKAKIIRERAKLESTLNSVVKFDPAAEFLAD